MEIIALEFLKELVVSASAEIILKKIEELQLKLPFLRHSTFLYRKGLRAKLNAMPFLYKDKELSGGDLLSDFVEVTFRRIGESSNEPIRRKIDISNEERLRRRRKALFLGSAGIGKTTFFRHTLLTYLDNAKSLPFFYEEEIFIPLYIPLKTIDNNAPAPILRHILKTTNFLKRGGLKKLIHLAERGKIMLFLDGYDEIPFASGSESGENYIQQELALIMGTAQKGARDAQFPKGDQQLFYVAAQQCRTWLSSRQEFFEQHSILPRTRPLQELDHLIAIRIEGIGNNKALLTHNIFERYRIAKPLIYQNILSEEYFLQELDSLETGEIRLLSVNPLFLTVMCYTYVQRARKKRDHKVRIAESREELILECINLLLFELDESKAAESSEAARAGILRRRNEFPAEKIEFLKFFAGELFIDQKTAFDYAYLKKKAGGLFSSREDENSHKILKGLRRRLSGLPNFAEQLVYSEVFVTVDKVGSEAIYDFPHRQFREVLACIYFDHSTTLPTLLSHVNLKTLSELFILFFQDTHFKEKTLDALLNATRDLRPDLYFGSLIIKCIEKQPEQAELGQTFERFVINTISADDSFYVPEALGNFFEPSEKFIRKVVEELKEAILHNRSRSLAVCCSVLLKYNRALLEEVLARTLGSPRAYDGTGPQLLFYSGLCDKRLIFANFKWIAADDEWFNCFCFLCATDLYSLIERYTFQEIIRDLSFERVVTLMHMLWEYRWQRSYTEPPVTVHPDSDFAFALAKNFAPQSQNRPPSGHGGIFVYAIGEAALAVLDLEVRKKVRLIKHNVYWTKEALFSRLDSLGKEESVAIGAGAREAIVGAAKFEATRFLGAIRRLQSLNFTPPAVVKVFEGIG